ATAADVLAFVTGVTLCEVVRGKRQQSGLKQVTSCHAVPGGWPALELTLSASPAYTTLQQSHLYQTFTFHCPPLYPATNLTPGEDCSPDSLAAHSHSRDCPLLTASPDIRESPGPESGS
ncbi:hypothetical protein GBF38_014516, partial [Nibea albiflora]